MPKTTTRLNEAERAACQIVAARAGSSGYGIRSVVIDQDHKPHGAGIATGRRPLIVNLWRPASEPFIHDWIFRVCERAENDFIISDLEQQLKWQERYLYFWEAAFSSYSVN